MEILQRLVTLAFFQALGQQCQTAFILPLFEEDEHEIKQNKHSYHIERGLRLTEGVYGVPVPIDNIFDQILSFPTDDQGQNIESECVGGSELSEMDMCLTPSQTGMFTSVGFHGPAGKRKRRQASANGFSLWKNGVIPYVFNSTFPPQDRDAILSAMSEWEKTTCIRFRPANRGDVDTVVFRDGRRCSTNIGRIGREQTVTLAKTCRAKRILVHELGHVIGLIHEHQRHDRDKYVKVLLENVRNMSQERYQFSKLLSGSITDKAVKYDYTSVMHYGRNYFAKSPELTTLQTTESLYQDVIGRAEKPSFGDTETVNRLYKCSAGCPPSLQCHESCYMDSYCVCRCRSGVDKTHINGPGSYQNSLLDSTCEFFASRGECTGNLKNTLRPLCAKTCDLHRGKHSTPSTEPWTQTPTSNINHIQSKPISSLWGTSPDTHGFMGPGRGNNFYNHEINNVNDVNFQRSGETLLPSLPIHVQQQQQYLQDRQMLAVSGTHDQTGFTLNSPQLHQDIMNSPLTDNLRAALQQRRDAQSSSEPLLLQSLISGSSSTDKTSQILTPTQDITRDMQQIGQQSADSHLNSLLRQETTKTPSTILQHLLSADSINGHNPFSGLSYWLSLSDVRQQHQRQQQQQQMLQKELQTRYRNVQTQRPSTVQNSETHMLRDLYDLTDSRVSGGLSNGGSNWQVDSGFPNRISQVGTMTGQTSDVRHSAPPDTYPGSGHNTMLPNGDYGISDQGQKVMESSMVSVTAGVDRVNSAVTSADFTGPEMDQSAASVSGGHNSSSSIMVGPDSSRNLQTTGPSFMKNSALPQSSVISEQNPPMGSPVGQIQNEPWNLQVQQITPLTELQLPGQTFQYFEPQQVQSNIDQFTRQSGQQGGQEQIVVLNTLSHHGTSPPNTEPFVDAVSFQNYQEPIDQHASENLQSPNHHVSAPVDSHNSRNPAPHQQQMSPLLQIINTHQSFTDPLASSRTSYFGNSATKQTENASAAISEATYSQNTSISGQNHGLDSLNLHMPHIPAPDSSLGDTPTNTDNPNFNSSSKILALHPHIINGILQTGHSHFLDNSAIISGVGSRLLSLASGQPTSVYSFPSIIHDQRQINSTSRDQNRALFAETISVK